MINNQQAQCGEAGVGTAVVALTLDWLVAMGAVWSVDRLRSELGVGSSWFQGKLYAKLSHLLLIPSSHV